MITTPSGRLAEKLRVLRSHGWARDVKREVPTDPRYTFIDWGFNVRPTEVAAAIGLVQLQKLTYLNRLRMRNFATIASAVADCDDIDIPQACEGTNWFGVPLFSYHKQSLVDFLEAHGVETRPILAGNLVRQPAFQRRAARHRPHLPGADRVHDQGLYIGLHAERNSDAERVGELLQKWAA